MVAAEQPETPVTEHPARPVDDSPAARAVHDTVTGVADVLGAGTQTVAWALRTVTGRQAPAGTTEPEAAAADLSAEQTSAEPAAEPEPEPEPAAEPEPEKAPDPEVTEDPKEAESAKDPEETSDEAPASTPDDRSAAAPVG